MAICLDASVLVLWLDARTNVPADPQTGEAIPRARERIEAHLESLANVRERIVVPMPALAECLTRGEGDVQSLMDVIGNLSSFDLAPFGQREAIELAYMNRAALATGDKRGGIEGKWQKIKIDRQIVATAKVADVSALYTDDDGMKRLGEAEGLRVVRTADLPPPTSQAELFEG